MTSQDFGSFREFYPYYLQEHSNKTCRRLHFIGTSLVIAIAAAALLTGNLSWLWALPLAGYGFAWLGHFGYEKNRPATFKHPWLSFLGDHKMACYMVSGRIDAEFERLRIPQLP